MILAQACVSVLIQMDDHYGQDNVGKNAPLADDNTQQLKGTEYLFDLDKPIFWGLAPAARHRLRRPQLLLNVLQIYRSFETKRSNSPSLCLLVWIPGSVGTVDLQIPAGYYVTQTKGNTS